MPELLGVGLLGDLGAGAGLFSAVAPEVAIAPELAGAAAEAGIGLGAGAGLVDAGLASGIASGEAGADFGLGGLGSGIVDAAPGAAGNFGVAGISSIPGTAGFAGGDFGALGTAATDFSSAAATGSLGATAAPFGELGGALGLPGADISGIAGFAPSAADISSGLAGGLPAGIGASEVAGGLPLATDPFSGAFAGGLPSTDPFAGAPFNPTGNIPLNPATGGPMPTAEIPTTPDFVAQAANPGLPGGPSFGGATTPSFGDTFAPVDNTSLVGNVTPTEAAQTGFGDQGFIGNQVNAANPGLTTPANQLQFSQIPPSSLNPLSPSLPAGPTQVGFAPDVGVPGQIPIDQATLPGQFGGTDFTSAPVTGVTPTTPTPVSADVASGLGTPPTAPSDISGGTPFTGQQTTFTPPSSGGATGGFTDFLAKNPMLALGGVGLAASLARTLMPVPGEAQLKALAAQLASNSAQSQANAQALLQPLISGQLPGPQAAQVQNALNDAINVIKARHVNDPGSSAEQGEIANAIQNSIVAAGQLESQMAQAGTSLSSQAIQGLNVENSIFQFLTGQQINIDNAFSQAIAAFTGQAAIASAISGLKPAA